MITSRTAILAAALASAACQGPAARGFDEPLELGGEVVSAELLSQGERDYLLHCRPCHGEAGDGRGPASPGMRPPPRDFRLGTFKFGAVASGALPRDDDLVRIVRGGLGGTAMFAWDDLPAPTLDGILQYIKTFSPRWRDETPGEAIPIPADPFAGDPAAGAARGFQVYHGLAQCLACHPAYASAQAIDAASRALAGRPAGELRPDPYSAELKDSDYGVKIAPPDFTFHELRSIRPLHRLPDLFRAIAAGVGGTAMPTWKGSLPDTDIWALAHYIDSLAALRGTPAAEELRRRNTQSP